jgi:two-component system response regulator LytT
MNVLIIEDEVNAFDYLTLILKQVRPGYNILKHLESVEDAINWLFKHEQPDLIFLDIQLSDGLSFEIFKHVDLTCPIIFTTAFDQYAIEAFKVNSIDYLLKPIHTDDLARAINKLEVQKKTLTEGWAPQLDQIFAQLNSQKKQRFLVKRGQHFEFINSQDIAYVSSEDSVTFLHTFQHQRHIYPNSVEEINRNLDPKQFFQINRSHIINIHAIQKAHSYFNQRLKLELLPAIQSDADLVVSRAKVQALKQWMDS